MSSKIEIDYDPYEALGLSFGATPKEVKKAYRDLARKHHPDKADEKHKETAEAAFHKIKEASDFLLDPEKKEHFDRHTKARLEQQKKREEKLSQTSAARKRMIEELEAAEKARTSKKVRKNEPAGGDYNAHLKQYHASMDSLYEKMHSAHRNTTKKATAPPSAPTVPDIDLDAAEEDVLADLL